MGNRDKGRKRENADANPLYSFYKNSPSCLNSIVLKRNMPENEEKSNAIFNHMNQTTMKLCL